MASEEDGAEKKVKTATSKQNEKLYAVEGMLNTKLKRAEKKKRKKADKLNSEDAMDESKDDGGNQIIGEVPMSGIELDDE
jgi:nuclear GTP-binding protein